MAGRAEVEELLEQVRQVEDPQEFRYIAALRTTILKKS